jgi:hypothetical protein
MEVPAPRSAMHLTPYEVSRRFWLKAAVRDGSVEAPDWNDGLETCRRLAAEGLLVEVSTGREGAEFVPTDAARAWAATSA